MTWTPTPPIKDSDVKWAAVDFDLTIAGNSGHPDFQPTKPIAENVLKLKELIKHGYKIVIHTSRARHEYILIEDWMNHHEVPFDKIVCGKLFAAKYIDDKAINAEEASWL
jgi:hypothetical protein